MVPHVYFVYGQRLESNIPLLLPLPIDSTLTDLSFVWKPHKVCFPSKVTWLHRWCRRDGSDWLYLAQGGKGYLLRLERSADFWLFGGGREIRAIPLRVLSPDFVEHMLVDHVLPFALALRGLRVFHASASCLGEKAVLFLGDAGTGKSSLVATLLAQRFPLITDDCAVVGVIDRAHVVLPGHPTLRLWPEVKEALLGGSRPSVLMEGKRVLQLEGSETFRSRAVALSRIYVLSPNGRYSSLARAEVLRGSQALIELFRHSYQLAFSDHSRLTQQLESFTDLVISVGVKRLRFPSSIEGVRRAAELVLSDIEQ